MRRLKKKENKKRVLSRRLRGLGALQPVAEDAREPQLRSATPLSTTDPAIVLLSFDSSDRVYKNLTGRS